MRLSISDICALLHDDDIKCHAHERNKTAQVFVEAIYSRFKKLHAKATDRHCMIYSTTIVVHSSSALC